MVRTYSATVKRGAITVRDVDLPDGTEVAVSIEMAPTLTLKEEDWAEIREAEAEFERGESLPAATLVQELRDASLRRQKERARDTPDPEGERLVGRAPERRDRPVRRRGR